MVKIQVADRQHGDDIPSEMVGQEVRLSFWWGASMGPLSPNLANRCRVLGCCELPAMHTPPKATPISLRASCSFIVCTTTAAINFSKSLSRLFSAASLLLIRDFENRSQLELLLKKRSLILTGERRTRIPLLSTFAIDFPTLQVATLHQLHVSLGRLISHISPPWEIFDH